MDVAHQELNDLEEIRAATYIDTSAESVSAGHSKRGIGSEYCIHIA